jgi:hypothetical protein
LKITPSCSTGANIIPLPNGWRLEIPAGEASAYRFAQLDDYTRLARRQFPSHAPLTLSLRARVSGNSIPGTWGFGLWNDPFGMSLGFGGNPLRLPALPNAIWFFYASEENWLSFSDHPGNGLLAQVFCSPQIPSGLLAPFGIPFLPFLATRKTRRLIRNFLRHIVSEHGFRLSQDAMEWHTYRLAWSPRHSAFWVDDLLMLESPVSATSPLGLVIWIDNQYAAFTPEGKVGFGILKNEAAWLEIENLELE